MTCRMQCSKPVKLVTKLISTEDGSQWTLILDGEKGIEEMLPSDFGYIEEPRQHKAPTGAWPELVTA